MVKTITAETARRSDRDRHGLRRGRVPARALLEGLSHGRRRGPPADRAPVRGRPAPQHRDRTRPPRLRAPSTTATTSSRTNGSWRGAATKVSCSATPVSTAWVYFDNDFPTTPSSACAKFGLKISLDCDDPPMFGTDPTKDLVVAHEHMGFGVEDFRQCMLNGIDGSWLDEPEKRSMRRGVGHRVRRARQPARLTARARAPDHQPGERNHEEGRQLGSVPTERSDRANEPSQRARGSVRSASAVWRSAAWPPPAAGRQRQLGLDRSRDDGW